MILSGGTGPDGRPIPALSFEDFLSGLASLRQNLHMSSVKRFRKGLLSHEGPGGAADRMLADYIELKSADSQLAGANQDAQSFLLLRTAFNACDVADGDGDGMVSGIVAALMLHCLVHAIPVADLLQCFDDLLGDSSSKLKIDVPTARTYLKRAGSGVSVQDPYSDDEETADSISDSEHLLDPYAGQYRVGVGGAHVRATAQLSSQKTGELPPNALIEVVEGSLLDGIVRLRYEGGLQDPNGSRAAKKRPQSGWISLMASHDAVETNNENMSEPIVVRTDGKDVGANATINGDSSEVPLPGLPKWSTAIDALQVSFEQFGLLFEACMAHPAYTQANMVRGVHECISAANLYRSLDRQLAGFAVLADVGRICMQFKLKLTVLDMMEIWRQLSPRGDVQLEWPNFLEGVMCLRSAARTSVACRRFRQCLLQHRGLGRQADLEIASIVKMSPDKQVEAAAAAQRTVEVPEEERKSLTTSKKDAKRATSKSTVTASGKNEKETKKKSKSKLGVKSRWQKVKANTKNIGIDDTGVDSGIAMALLSANVATGDDDDSSDGLAVGASLLFAAAAAGNVDGIRRALRGVQAVGGLHPVSAVPPVDPNHRDRATGRTALIISTIHGRLAAVAEVASLPSCALDLVDDHRNWSALHYAARWGLTDITTLLLDFGADPIVETPSGLTARALAVHYGHLSAINAIDEHEDPTAAISKTSSDDKSDLSDNSKGWGRAGAGQAETRNRREQNTQKLFAAASTGDTLTVWNRLQGGLSPDVRLDDERDWSALHIAANAGHAGVVALLLEFGASSNVSDKHGWSALMLAVRWGHLGIASMILNTAKDQWRGGLHPAKKMLTATTVERDTLDAIAEEHNHGEGWHGLVAQLELKELIDVPSPSETTMLPGADTAGSFEVEMSTVPTRAGLAAVDDDDLDDLMGLTIGVENHG
eukprot:SAG31_NODE_96_length_25743_cov_56.175948_2_plen_935_part_00